MRRKHRNDKNHGKDGMIGGNRRTGRSRGHRRADAPAEKRQVKKEIEHDTDKEIDAMIERAEVEDLEREIEADLD